MLEQATTIRWTPVWATPAVWLSQQPAQPPSSPGTPNQLDKSLTTYADDVARAVQTNPAFQMYIAMLFSSQQLTQALAPDFSRTKKSRKSCHSSVAAKSLPTCVKRLPPPALSQAKCFIIRGTLVLTLHIMASSMMNEAEGCRLQKKIYFGEILGQVPGAPVATGYFPQHGMRGSIQ